MIEAARRNPIKAASASIITTVALIAGIWQIDDRYAHAADTQHFQVKMQEQVQQSFTELRRSMIEDEIFVLDFTEGSRPLSPMENAQRERLKRKLEELH